MLYDLIVSLFYYKDMEVGSINMAEEDIVN